MEIVWSGNHIYCEKCFTELFPQIEKSIINKTKNSYMKFYDFIETQASLECTVIGCTSSLTGCDSYEVASEAEKLKWQITKYNVYCPLCAKEKIKSK
jgi:hypothetical protein